MAVLSFSDTAGREWQVYQVRRASAKAGAVSPGREAGWLAFTSGDERRRLAPFPADWESLAPATLAELCARADVIAADSGKAPTTRRTPRLVDLSVATEDRSNRNVEPQVIRADTNRVLPTLSEDVQETLRAHAASAREAGQTVISAMVELRPILAARGIEPRSDMFRSARQVFLDAFYFTSRPSE